MARRRELKSLASGMAAHCVSRNNDIFGYWGVGVFYNLATERGEDRLSVNLKPEHGDCSEFLAFRNHFLDRFETASNDLSRFIEHFEVDFRFEPYSRSEPRGQCARVVCSVHIHDDLGKRRSASATTFCYQHDPRFEHKSTRG